MPDVYCTVLWGRGSKVLIRTVRDVLLKVLCLLAVGRDRKERQHRSFLGYKWVFPPALIRSRRSGVLYYSPNSVDL